MQIIINGKKTAICLCTMIAQRSFVRRENKKEQNYACEQNKLMLFSGWCTRFFKKDNFKSYGNFSPLLNDLSKFVFYTLELRSSIIVSVDLIFNAGFKISLKLICKMNSAKRL